MRKVFGSVGSGQRLRSTQEPSSPLARATKKEQQECSDWSSDLSFAKIQSGGKWLICRL